MKFPQDHSAAPMMSSRQSSKIRSWSWLPFRGVTAWICAGVYAVSSALPVWATVYHVDFAGGNNAADGLTPATAWKHSPGDRNATGKPAEVALEPGDTVLFKGGVTYFGEVVVNASGAEGKPITFDGNSAGTYGQGRAILDGAAEITNWKPVESAEAVGGNPLWKQIRYADIDVDLTSNFNQGVFVSHRSVGEAKQAPWQRVFLIDRERAVLPIAQEPKPTDAFYPDIPADFFVSPNKLTDSYPHKIYYEPGTKGNATLPLIGIVNGSVAPVIQPINGGAVSVDLNQPAEVAEIGVTLFRPASEPAPEKITFLADGREITTVTLDPASKEMQKFRLPNPVQAKKITFRLSHGDPSVRQWTKVQQLAAFTASGENILEHDLSSMIVDDQRLTQQDPSYYDGMFVGVHGGNNHVYFARARSFDPKAHELTIPHFAERIYDQTRYAFYNSPKFLSIPGEWCLAEVGNKQTRVFFLPTKDSGPEPVGIGYPSLKTGIQVAGGTSYVVINNFLVQRFTGGKGGIAAEKSNNLTIANCEVRFVSGDAGINLVYCNDLVLEKNEIHGCPGWTVGIYINRVQNFRVFGNRLVKNSGSGIRHYESKKGHLYENTVLDHFGMHSSALNFYEGCADIVFERNRIENVIAINRNAENFLFQNNLINGMGRSNVGVAMWTSGKVGGTAIRNLQFINNTIVNLNKTDKWGGAIFGQAKGSPSSPEGLVIKNNILDGLGEDLPGLIENNIFTRKVDARFMAKGCIVVEDENLLFVDAAKGDFQLKAGSPAIGAGAPVDVKDDITGAPRPADAIDIGAYQYQATR